MVDMITDHVAFKLPLEQIYLRNCPKVRLLFRSVTNNLACHTGFHVIKIVLPRANQNRSKCNSLWIKCITQYNWSHLFDVRKINFSGIQISWNENAHTRVTLPMFNIAHPFKLHFHPNKTLTLRFDDITSTKTHFMSVKLIN